MDEWAEKLFGAFHHYVPKFYLRRFADARGQIRVYDLEKRKSYSNNINRTAGERGLNSIVHMEFDDENKRVFVEQMFSELESKYATHMGAIFRLVDEGLNLVEETRYTLAHMIFTQIYRSPRFYTIYGEVVQKSWLEYVKNAHGIDSSLASFIPRPIDYAFHLAKMMVDPKIGNSKLCDDLVSKYYWILLVNDSPVPFLTSDNPVIIHSPTSLIEVVCYPLSPRVCVQLLLRKAYPQFSNRDGMHLHSNDKRAAIDINHNLFSTAERFVFGLPPNTFIEKLVS